MTGTIGFAAFTTYTLTPGMSLCGRSRLFLFAGLPQADRLNDGRHALNGGRSLASPQ
jgi:hypothetical protein